MDIRLFGPTEAKLERGLDLAARRHELVASNIANIDTPGYQPRHLSFEEALGRVEVEGQAAAIAIRRTDPRHLEAGAQAAPAPRVITEERPARADGNGVDPEREMSDLAENAITFTTLAQLLGGRVRTLKSALREGR